MRLPNTASLALAPDRRIGKRPCRMRTWQQTVIELPAVRRCAALAVRNREAEVWLPGRITVSVAFPEIAPALDNSDEGIPHFGSPQAIEKTKGKQAYSHSWQATLKFSQTGQMGSAGVIEFPTMRSPGDFSQAFARVAPCDPGWWKPPLQLRADDWSRLYTTEPVASAAGHGVDLVLSEMPNVKD